MLARSTTVERVRQLFSQFGALKEVHLMRDQRGQSKGCAFVKYLTREAALTAIATLNDIFQDYVRSVVIIVASAAFSPDESCCCCCRVHPAN